MQASFKQVDFNIREFKVFKGTGASEHEMLADEQLYISRLQELKSFLEGSQLNNVINKFPLLQGIPMSPFPKYQRCLGATHIDGNMQIEERFMRIAFNVRLEKADEACLYSDFEKKQAPGVANFFKNFNLAEMTGNYNKVWERRQAARKAGKNKQDKKDE